MRVLDFHTRAPPSTTENVTFAIQPFFVLYAIYLQVDHLTGQVG